MIACAFAWLVEVKLSEGFSTKKSGIIGSRHPPRKRAKTCSSGPRHAQTERTQRFSSNVREAILSRAMASNVHDTTTTTTNSDCSICSINLIKPSLRCLLIFPQYTGVTLAQVEGSYRGYVRTSLASSNQPPYVNEVMDTFHPLATTARTAQAKIRAVNEVRQQAQARCLAIAKAHASKRFLILSVAV